MFAYMRQIIERLTTPDPLVEAGKAALADALACHALDVVDPRRSEHSVKAERDRDIIADMMQSPAGLHLTRQDYEGDGAFEWCTAAWLRWWGDRLRFSRRERQTYFASTYRLHALFHGISIFGVPCPVRPGRGVWKFSPAATDLPDGYEPRAGDLLIVGDGDPRFGDHGTLVRGYDWKRRMLLTVEGNATKWVGKVKRQGVILGERPVGNRGAGYFAMFAYRPSVEDLA